MDLDEDSVHVNRKGSVKVPLPIPITLTTTNLVSQTPYKKPKLPHPKELTFCFQLRQYLKSYQQNNFDINFNARYSRTYVNSVIDQQKIILEFGNNGIDQFIFAHNVQK